MSISTPFIKRPVATSLLTLALAMAGALAFYFLPVAPLPQVEYPTLNVNANLPGASPDTMASAVTTPLERSFGRIAGITEMTSSSNTGQAQITHAVRPRPQYRRGRARCSGGDQRGARSASGESAQQSELPEKQSVRSADRDSGVDVGHRRSNQDLRCRRLHPESENRANSGRRPGSDSRKLAAGRARANQSRLR